MSPRGGPVTPPGPRATLTSEPARVATVEPRRAVIVATAGKLFAASGFSATTVRAIATEVGILSGSLYRHFESKEAIADEIISTYLDELHRSYETVLEQHADPVTTLRALIRTSLETALTHASATIIYQQDGNYLRTLPRFTYLTAAGATVQKTWLAVLEEGVSSGQLRSDIDPAIAYRLIRDGIWLSVRWYRPTDDYPVTRFASDCADFYLAGYMTSSAT
jgi:AcrR family transcriptional regulator